MTANQNAGLALSCGPHATRVRLQKRLPITAIVLAAGAGERYRRMSGEFKLLARLSDGRPVIRATCELATEVASHVVVVGRCELAGMRQALSGLPATLLACPTATLGPGEALRKGVATAPDDHAVMVFLGDMPYISRITTQTIHSALLRGAALVRPAYNGIPGHPVGFAPGLRDELLALGPGHGAAPLLRRHQRRLQYLSVPDAGCVYDIDVPEDIRSTMLF